MINDAAPAREHFRVKPNDSIRYVVIRKDAIPVGMFLLAGGPEEAEIHFCLLPQVWGESFPVGWQAIVWIWTHTQIQKLTGPVPSYNRLALKFARRMGFRPKGIRPGGTKHGKLFHLILMELPRP